MTVRLSTNGEIELIGHCSSEDAETLQRNLLEQPGKIVNWGECQHIHAAVLQVLLAANPVMSGLPPDPFLAAHVARLLKIAATDNI